MAYQATSTLRLPVNSLSLGLSQRFVLVVPPQKKTKQKHDNAAVSILAKPFDPTNPGMFAFRRQKTKKTQDKNRHTEWPHCATKSPEQPHVLTLTLVSDFIAQEQTFEGFPICERCRIPSCVRLNPRRLRQSPRRRPTAWRVGVGGVEWSENGEPQKWGGGLSAVCLSV